MLPEAITKKRPAAAPAETWYRFHYDFLTQKGYRVREGEAPCYTTQVESGIGPNAPAILRFEDGVWGLCSNLTTSEYEGRKNAWTTSRRYKYPSLWCATREGVGTQLTIRELPDRSPIYKLAERVQTKKKGKETTVITIRICHFDTSVEAFDYIKSVGERYSTNQISSKDAKRERDLRTKEKRMQKWQAHRRSKTGKTARNMATASPESKGKGKEKGKGKANASKVTAKS